MYRLELEYPWGPVSPSELGYPSVRASESESESVLVCWLEPVLPLAPASGLDSAYRSL